jgi:hypothetical protein
LNQRNHRHLTDKLYQTDFCSITLIYTTCRRKEREKGKCNIPIVSGNIPNFWEMNHAIPSYLGDIYNTHVSFNL